jgi:hypothetical protein
MTCARLLYWGAEDRQVAKRFRRLGRQLMLQDVDFIEFPGFDHQGCNTPGALERSVVPAAGGRVSQRLGHSWSELSRGSRTCRSPRGRCPSIRLSAEATICPSRRSSQLTGTAPASPQFPLWSAVARSRSR